MNTITTTREAFYDKSLFPDLKELFDNWEVIREEFLSLNAPQMGIARIDKTRDELREEITAHIQAGNEYGWLLGWGKVGGNYDWIQYGIMMYETILPFIGPKKLEKTVEILKKIKGIKMCAFTILKPHSLLNYHDHPEILTENLLQLHLPLKTAKTNNFSYINVDGEFRQHIDGEPIIFDGSLNHFAINESDEDRVIVYMEFSKELMKTP